MAKAGFSPLAFGHGLSYTTFRFAGLKAARAGMGVSASFTVANTGRVAGAAVAQLYASTPFEPASAQRPVKRLEAHSKVTLQPGQIILGGSFTRPVAASPGDTFHVDYDMLGSIACRFV